MRKGVHLAVAICIAALAFVTSVSQADHPSVTLGNGPGGPVSTISGTTLPSGQWAIGLRIEHTNFDPLTDEELIFFREQDEDADIHSVDSVTNGTLGLSFGVNDNLTVGFTLPYIKRNNIREAEHGHDDGHDDGGEQQAGHDDGEEMEAEPEVERLGNSKGIGDAQLFAQYRLFHNPDTNTHFSAIAGLKLPTGETSEISAEGERLELELQPGSGSWDPLFGGAFTRDWERFGIDASLLYQLTTEGNQDTDLGDVFSYNAGLSYRLGGGDIHHHDDGEQHNHSWLSGVDMILELNGEWRDKEDTGGINDPNSGGNLLFLSPGVRASGNSWSASFSFGIPISSDLNGVQVEPDWRIIGGLSAVF